jgi:apolipoprotein N-acyltransferase
MAQILLRIGAALGSGALFLLALPPADVAPLGWIVLAPLFLAVRGRGFAFAFLVGLGACLFAAYLSTIGVFYPWDRLEGDPGWHYVGFLLFGVVIALIAGAVGEWKELTLRRAVLLAAAAVLLEAILLVYLPAHLALTQYRSPAMMQVTQVTGIWGVSFLVWLTNLAVAAVLSRGVAKLRSKAAVVAATAALIAMTLLWQWPPPATPSDPLAAIHPETTRVAVIQTISMEPEDLEELHRQATDLGADLVVWPELSATGAVVAGDAASLRDLSAQGQAPFITSFPDPAEPLPYNVAALYKAGLESARYRKRKPFGGERQMHQPGSDAVAVPFREKNVGLNICFDSCFPYVMRETAQLEEVALIALPCMGPETPYGFIQAVHGAYTPFRSAEMGVAIARGESSAFAMITDGRGRIVAEAPPGYVGALAADVELVRRSTLYARFGEWFLLAAGLLFTALLVAEVRSGGPPGTKKGAGRKRR